MPERFELCGQTVPLLVGREAMTADGMACPPGGWA